MSCVQVLAFLHLNPVSPFFHSTILKLTYFKSFSNVSTLSLFFTWNLSVALNGVTLSSQQCSLWYMCNIGTNILY